MLKISPYRCRGDYIEVCERLIQNVVLIVIGLSNCPIAKCPITW